LKPCWCCAERRPGGDRKDSLEQERKLSPQSINTFVSAVQFLYLVTLEMPWDERDFPRARLDQKLPVVLVFTEKFADPTYYDFRLPPHSSPNAGPKALPHMLTPVVSVILAFAMMSPLNLVDVPRVAELTACQMM
jgi:hypothetical protein